MILATNCQTENINIPNFILYIDNLIFFNVSQFLTNKLSLEYS